jgi:hypothetical protein
MKKPILMGMMALLSACAGMTRQMSKSDAGEQRWEGFVLRDGIQLPVIVELARASADWTGRVRIGDSSIPLEHVRLTPLAVHFELPGAGAFDGTVAGNSMAGSVSGNAPGGFALTRDQEQANPSDVRYSGDFAGGP